MQGIELAEQGSEQGCRVGRICSLWRGAGMAQQGQEQKCRTDGIGDKKNQGVQGWLAGWML